MRLARLLLGGVVLLLALGLAAAWFLPPLLDWGRYRDSIATLASERLGREVRIAGRVSLTLLPEPELTADGVSLADAGDGVAIRAAQLRLRVALGALAAGRIDAQELVLRGAEMHVPWPFRPLRIAADAPAWFTAASVRIEDGQLSIGGLAFTDIQASLTTDAWTGSYAAAGTVQFSAQPWHFTARLTRAGSDGAAGLDVSLDGRAAMQGIGATLNGQLQGDGTFGGRLMGRGPDLSRLLPAPAVPFTAEGRVSVAGGLAAADEMAGVIGGSPVKGAVALRVLPVPRLDVALTASRLDLDAWLPALLHGRAAPLPVGINLSVDAAPLGGGTLRRLRGAFDIGADGVAVREFRAVLPGGASLGATGDVRRADANAPPRFEGDVALSAPALRTTLAWLQSAGAVPAGELPEGVLRTAEMTARAALEPGSLSLIRLDGRVDATRLSGSLTFRPARPALRADLQADRLELDPWLPAAWPSLAAIGSRLVGMDADLKLTAGRVVANGTQFGALSFEAAVDNGRMELRRLELAGDGLRAVASGTLGEDGRITDGRLDIQTPSAGALAALLAPRLLPPDGAAGIWGGAASLSVLASGAPDALALQVAGNVGDLAVEARPVIDVGARRATGVLTLRHPGAPRLAGSLGLHDVPAWLGDGSLSLIAQLSVQAPVGQPGRIAAESFVLTAGSLRASGALTLDKVGGSPSPPVLSGRIVADTLPLPLFYPRAPRPLHFGVLAGWQARLKLEAAQVLAGAVPVLQHAEATVALADGKLRIEDLSARLGGGTLSGSASVDITAEPPAMTLDVGASGVALGEPLFGLPVDIASGRLDASASLSASGYSPAALLSTLTGEARLQAADGTLDGVSLGSAGGSLPDPAVRTALAGGTTAFTRLDLTLRAQGGVLRVAEGRMTGPSGAATLTGSIDLASDTAELRLGLLPAVVDPPEIGLFLDGPLDALRRMPELAAVARWRADHPAAP